MNLLAFGFQPSLHLVVTRYGFLRYWDLLFRVIDIFKPLGCRWIDQNLKGGWGVMLDDALAGFYVLVIAYVVKIVLI